VVTNGVRGDHGITRPVHDADEHGLPGDGVTSPGGRPDRRRVRQGRPSGATARTGGTGDDRRVTPRNGDRCRGSPCGRRPVAPRPCGTPPQPPVRLPRADDHGRRARRRSKGAPPHHRGRRHSSQPFPQGPPRSGREPEKSWPPDRPPRPPELAPAVRHCAACRSLSTHRLPAAIGDPPRAVRRCCPAQTEAMSHGAARRRSDWRGRPPAWSRATGATARRFRKGRDAHVSPAVRRRAGRPRGGTGLPGGPVPATVAAVLRVATVIVAVVRHRPRGRRAAPRGGCSDRSGRRRAVGAGAG
jgi:hypothetical protein